MMNDRKKHLFRCHLLLLLFLVLSLSGQTQGILKTEGTKIVNASGEEVIFRGIGLGGWMLQEGYMLGTSGPQHEIEAKIEALIGAEKKAEFYEAWLANHTRKIDIDSMAAWGYNMVRLPMHYKWFTPPIDEEPVAGEITWLDKGFEMTDWLLEWCRDNNMYLILDLHAAPGGQGENADISDYDSSKPSLWESDANKAKTVALWRKLAERYADEPVIAGYDLINEPNWGFQNHNSDPNGCSESQNTPLWDLQREITEAIREVDRQHIIIIEGNCWGNNYAGLPQLWDDNLVISYHKYWNANSQGAIQHMLDMRQNRNVPIWLGETGENSNTWFTNAITLLETNGIGWAWWPLKKQGYNNPLQIVRNEGYQNILDYWNGDAPKPSENEAYEALMQLAENLKLENNLYHPSVVDAMIRQPHSDEAIPFKSHHLRSGEGTIIFSTDFDMGRHGVAYQDKEVENTTGNAGGQAWNLGYSYRNDGVDIEASEDEVTNGYNIGWTEDGEWLQYTVEVEEAGNYDLKVRTAATTGTGRFSLSADGSRITAIEAVPNTGGYQEWATMEINDVPLPGGMVKIRLLVESGGFNLNYLEFNGPKELSTEQPRILEGTGQHSEQEIDLLFNQHFDPLPAEHGFKVAVNGVDVVVTDAYLKAGNSRIITLETASPIEYGTEVLVSYAGTGVTTVGGTSLAAFSDEMIRITLAGGVIPLAVPGKIQTEAYVYNSGFEFEETTDTGGGENAGYTDSGDYLDFMVMVDASGYYEVGFRVASLAAGGAIRLQQVDDAGVTDLAEIAFEATGGWQTWTTVSDKNFYLQKGIRTLRLLAIGNQFNINWMELSYLSAELLMSTDHVLRLSLYPNPSTDTVHLVLGDPLPDHQEVFIFDMSGKRQPVISTVKTSNVLTVKHNLKKGNYLCVVERDGRTLSEKLLVR